MKNKTIETNKDSAFRGWTDAEWERSRKAHDAEKAKWEAAKATAIKVGLVELSVEEAGNIAESTPFVAAFRSVYHVKRSRSVSSGFVARLIHKERGDLPLTKRGRFVALTAEEANSLVGFEKFIN